MGLYNFQKRFVPFIMSGQKTHTIRATRKHPAKVGETLHLYTGLRQKGAQLLMRVPCTKVEEVRLSVDELGEAHVYISGVRLAPDERTQLALRDGFQSWRDMADFWNGRYPFDGQIIHWRLPR